MTERRPQSPFEGEIEQKLPASELGANIDRISNRFREALRAAPEVSRVLLASFLDPKKYSESIEDEGMEQGGNGMVFHSDHGESAYRVSLDSGTTDPIHNTHQFNTFFMERYTLRDGKVDARIRESVQMGAVKDLADNLEQAYLIYSHYDDTRGASYDSDTRGAVNSADRLLVDFIRGK